MEEKPNSNLKGRRKRAYSGRKKSVRNKATIAKRTRAIASKMNYTQEGIDVMNLYTYYVRMGPDRDLERVYAIAQEDERLQKYTLPDLYAMAEASDWEIKAKEFDRGLLDRFTERELSAKLEMVKDLRGAIQGQVKRFVKMAEQDENFLIITSMIDVQRAATALKILDELEHRPQDQEAMRKKELSESASKALGDTIKNLASTPEGRKAAKDMFEALNRPKDEPVETEAVIDVSQ